MQTIDGRSDKPPVSDPIASVGASAVAPAGATPNPGDGPSEADEANAVAEDVLRALRRILQGITLHSRQLYRTTGLTLPQLLCLKAIAAGEGGEVTAAQVSRAVRLSPATVTGILDRLERAALVVRERTSRDRRKICLNLTPAGRDRIQAVSPSLQDRFVARLGKLESADRRAILDALNRIVGMVEASDLDGAPILDVGDVTAG